MWSRHNKTRFFIVDYYDNVTSQQLLKLMDRVSYYEVRESRALPQMSPNYHKSPQLMETKDLAVSRTVLVDRIFRLGFMYKAQDATLFAAVRLFDRCMGDINPPVYRTTMSVLAVACFDIVFKYNDHEELVRFDKPLMQIYYEEGYASGANEHHLNVGTFSRLLNKVELVVLGASDGQPYAPTPYDYLQEYVPDWPHGRKASLLISALCSMSSVTMYTSEEIAVAVVKMLSRDHDELPDKNSRQIILKMAASVEVLFGLGHGTMLYLFYNDLYKIWLSNKK